MPKYRIFVIYSALCILLTAGLAAGTTVTLSTNMGNIAVELYDDVAPKTVANFLNYVNDGDYTNSIIHRSLPGFIIQGGGYTTISNPPTAIQTDPPVENEFSVSNTRGTIAMAKVGGDPDSATSQWFFNLADNSDNLDNQNGGFTVFGHALKQGMDAIDAIASLPVYDASILLESSAFKNLPLLGDGSTKYFVSIYNITVNSAPGYGDIDGDGQAGLSDTILILKILAGLETDFYIPKAADINGDGKIGMKEAVYTLQAVAGIISE